MTIYRMDDPAYWIVPENYTQFDDLRTSHLLLGEQDPASPRVVIMDMGPGFVIPRHMHGCERFQMVVKGSLYSHDGILYPGDIMIAHAGEVYGPKVAGADGCMTVEFFAQLGTSQSVYELADGSMVKFNPGSGEQLPENLAQSDWVEERQKEIAAISAK